MRDLLLVVTNDMKIRSEIETAAGEEMFDCYFVSQGEHLLDLVSRMNPCMMIVDFTSQETEWIMKHLSEIKEDHQNLPIIGISSGALESDIMRLEKAGCNPVLKKAAFSKKLPQLIKHHLG